MRCTEHPWLNLPQKNPKNLWNPRTLAALADSMDKSMLLDALSEASWPYAPQLFTRALAPNVFFLPKWPRFPNLFGPVFWGLPVTVPQCSSETNWRQRLPGAKLLKICTSIRALAEPLALEMAVLTILLRGGRGCDPCSPFVHTCSPGPHVEVLLTFSSHSSTLSSPQHSLAHSDLVFTLLDLVFLAQGPGTLTF